jgi:hypothetical protein
LIPLFVFAVDSILGQGTTRLELDLESRFVLVQLFVSSAKSQCQYFHFFQGVFFTFACLNRLRFTGFIGA